MLGDEKKIFSSDPQIKKYLDQNPKFIEQWRIDRGSEPENLTPQNILTENGLVFTGGTEPTAIFLSNFFGLCEEEKLPSKDEKSIENHLQEIRRFHKNRMKSGYCDISEIHQPIGEIQDWTSKIAAHSFANWIDNTCGDRIKPNHPIIPKIVSIADSLEEYELLKRTKRVLPSEGIDLMFSEVDKNLNAGRAVAVGASWNNLLRKDPRHPLGDHSFVVAARKQIGKECFYFIRNSVGDDSTDYLPKFKNRYESGGVWITRSELPSIYSVTSIE